MRQDNDIHELLLRWQEAQDAGQPVSVDMLCDGDSEKASALDARIEALQCMQWMDQSAALSTGQDTKTTIPVSGWQAGQEPVPGYQLIKPLGRGGFSEVWQAEGPHGIPLAMKLVLADRTLLEEKSLELLKTIRHPRIVSIMGAWSVQNGFALAMELADQSVHDRWQSLAESPEIRQALSEATLTAGAEALDYLSTELHIQHRDVKPQNFLMMGEFIKLADFGIAKVVEDHSTGHTGYFTVAYAPPEFFRGRSATTSDQYSLAVTYTLLRTGKLPFVGNSAAMTYGHLHRTPDLSGLPAEERGAVARALSKEPKDRWPTCQAFADAVLNKKKIYLLPKTRRRLLQGAAAAAVIGGGWLFWPRSEPKMLRLKYKCEVPADEKNGLYLRQVVGANQAVREQGRLIRYDFYVLGNGMYGAYLWDGNTGKLIRPLTKEPGVAAAIPGTERPWCVTGENMGKLSFWDMHTRKCTQHFKAHDTTQHVTAISLSSDSYSMVTCSTDGIIKVWERSKVPGKTSEFIEQPKRVINAGNTFIRSVRFMPNGRDIISVGNDGLLQRWDATTGELVNKINVSMAPLLSVEVSTDSRYVLTGGDDHIVRLWEMENSKKLLEMRGHVKTIEGLGFSSDGKYLISSSYDHTLRLWNRNTGREEFRAVHETMAHGICPPGINTNGPYLLVATQETIYAWEIEE